jgi:hypothetical protein
LQCPFIGIANLVNLNHPVSKCSSRCRQSKIQAKNSFFCIINFLITIVVYYVETKGIWKEVSWLWEWNLDTRQTA